MKMRWIGVCKMRQIYENIAGRKMSCARKPKVSTLDGAPERTYLRTDNGAIRIQSMEENSEDRVQEE